MTMRTNFIIPPHPPKNGGPSTELPETSPEQNVRAPDRDGRQGLKTFDPRAMTKQHMMRVKARWRGGAADLADLPLAPSL